MLLGRRVDSVVPISVEKSINCLVKSPAPLLDLRRRHLLWGMQIAVLENPKSGGIWIMLCLSCSMLQCNHTFRSNPLRYMRHRYDCLHWCNLNSTDHRRCILDSVTGHPIFAAGG